MNIFFLLPCQCFIVVVGNIGKLSQHGSACLERLTQQLQAGNSAERIACLDAFAAKKDKGIIGFKNLWGQEGGGS